MKLFLRIAIFALLVASVLQGVWPHLHFGTVSPSHWRPSVSLALIRQRGELRLAVTDGSMSFFFFEGNPSGFEYDLLSAYATNLEMDVMPVAVRSAGEAAALLISGKVDVAVLPAEYSRIDGALRTAAYLRPGGREEGAEAGVPETGALFVGGDRKELLASLNEFLAHSSRDGTVKTLFERYFVNNRRFALAGRSRRMTQLSPYDALIVKHASTVGMDWRLIAAVICEESTFDAAAVSPKGAMGLMQLMPEVADKAGVRNLSDPDANIRAGVHYLRRLSQIFPGTREGDVAILLAAYLIGPGHVLDAQQLARELHLDPEAWSGGLEEVLPLLEDPAHYSRSRLGFAQGQHAVEYVNRVLRRYDLYKRHLPIGPQRTASAETSGGSA